MHLSRNISIVLLVLFLASSLAWAQNSTLHIRVQEGELERLSLNLPVSVISAVLPLVEDKVRHLTGENIEMGGQDFGIAELREIWNALKADGSYELANIQTGEENIRILLDENSLFIDTDEASKEQIHVRIPVQVVDALLSGTGDELNLSEALETLASIGESDLIEVQASDAHVRVWID